MVDFAGAGGEALEADYRKLLQKLGSRGGMLGPIFRKAKRMIQEPASGHGGAVSSLRLPD